jgi:hypothetical protein
MDERQKVTLEVAVSETEALVQLECSECGKYEIVFPLDHLAILVIALVGICREEGIRPPDPRLFEIVPLRDTDPHSKKPN